MNSLAAIVFMLESQTTMEGLHKGMDMVLKWPDNEKRQTLNHAIANLVTRVWRKKLPDVPMPRDGVNHLKGVFSMLSENIDIIIADREKKAMKQGLEQGLEKGIEQGLEKGLEQGLVKGLEQGLEKGLEQGLEKGLEQGLEQGERQGNASMFKAMVAIRFGSVPDHIATQIDHANADQLVAWGKRLFVASDLDAVFAVN